MIRQTLFSLATVGFIALLVGQLISLTTNKKKVNNLQKLDRKIAAVLIEIEAETNCQEELCPESEKCQDVKTSLRRLEKKLFSLQGKRQGICKKPRRCRPNPWLQISIKANCPRVKK